MAEEKKDQKDMPILMPIGPGIIVPIDPQDAANGFQGIADFLNAEPEGIDLKDDWRHIKRAFHSLFVKSQRQDEQIIIV